MSDTFHSAPKLKPKGGYTEKQLSLSHCGETTTRVVHCINSDNILDFAEGNPPCINSTFLSVTVGVNVCGARQQCVCECMTSVCVRRRANVYVYACVFMKYE